MSRRAFTLIELAIVMSCVAVMMPLLFQAVRLYESQHHVALAQLDAARGMRDLSEELRRDLRTMKPAAGEGLVLESTGKCSRLEYRVGPDGVVTRAGEGCGEARPVAAHVKSLAREPWGVRVTFTHLTGQPAPLETAFSFAFPVQPAVVEDPIP